MGGKGGATGTGRDEEIADGGEDGDEPLQASRRSKALHRPLASSQRQVRVLGPVVEALVRAMFGRWHDLAPGGGIGAELVGNHAPGRTALLLKETRQQALCRLGVASRLDDFIEDISVLIDRPPQPMLFAADGDDDLVEVPDIAAARSLALEAAGIIARTSSPSAAPSRRRRRCRAPAASPQPGEGSAGSESTATPPAR